MTLQIIIKVLFMLQVRMLADPTGAFTKVNVTIYADVLCGVYSSAFVLLLFRQLTCCLTVNKLCRYLETSDPRGKITE